ncbi:PREDICTED: cation/H(+) antiporter 4 isoform X2 [Tarenaya hassleriana]|uniref:cation/H(+) antiporter 4 isoform X2 n=1 Tax=Tarenaya hassleriana TaxID=28532 RepID=UPI00053C1310|nr:PREDICTED: cation/H(+) antiporter 4 isoform X2 [Tarenaya hassleriana]
MDFFLCSSACISAYDLLEHIPLFAQAGILLSKTFVKENTAIRVFFSSKDYKETAVGLMAAVSYIMFWFLMGVKMDIGLIHSRGKRAITIGVSSVLLSVLVCSMVYFGNLWEFGSKEGKPDTNTLEAVVIYSIQCLSSFPVAGNLLFELRLQNSELGRLAMSSAVICDFISGILAASLIFLKELNDDKVRIGSTFIGDVFYIARPVNRAITLGAFLFFVIYIFRPLMFSIIRKTPSGRRVKTLYISFIIVIVFGSAIVANWAKQFVAIGPFILGLAVPHGPPLGSALIEKFEPAFFGTLLPFFVATSATEINIGAIQSWNDFTNIISIVFLALVVKFVLTALPALFFRIPPADCFALSLIMSFKGIFELGAYALAFNKGSIRPEVFTVVSLYIMLNSAIIPPILRRIYDPSRVYAGYEKRNMLHLKPSSELKILTCIYRTDDIRPMINLLEASCPSRESPISAYALHLMELVGQANPVFISHQMQSGKAEDISYSDNVVVSFEQFRNDHYGFVSVNIYTALSVAGTMHDDICLLALNNRTSLIVLPFHQTWSVDGSTIISDSSMIRELNKSVLELAPCSVGVFVYRSSYGRKTIRDTVSTHSSSYQVCMVFLGGKDDREALILARRMARDSRINLSIVRLISPEQKIREQMDWESMIDSELLKEVKKNTKTNSEILYTEEVVRDATETSELLKSMANDYDLFIVGRGKEREMSMTDGLEQWSEFSELGVIGDLLTLRDFECQASVLVIQQQQQMI